MGIVTAEEAHKPREQAAGFARVEIRVSIRAGGVVVRKMLGQKRTVGQSRIHSEAQYPNPSIERRPTWGQRAVHTIMGDDE